MTDSSFEDLCDRFEAAWCDGQPLSLEEVLGELASGDRDQLLRALLEIELEYRFASDNPPALEEYQSRFTKQRAIVEEAFAAARRRVQPSRHGEPAETHGASDAETEPIVEDDLNQIGPYKILQPIGQGGMGQVYLAEQTKPVKRRVALKVIKTDMPTKEILARFEAERQALAMMDHHNIAKVFDAGVTGSGRPYFVMELVKGIPITDYCDKNKLSPDERLELFVQTCRAIQHAHTKGIVHRDIKPSNVLVTLSDEQPTVKVIDFGLAKALHETTQLTDRTLFTRHGQFVGTLAYMSPEQAELNTLDIDTRTDVYSLGVVLYELLTGSTPITAEEIRSKAFDRILALIRESDPPRPSVRLSDSGDEIRGISQQRRTEPRRLSLILKGDLDWIAIKALDKDRNRRYDTPAALADDVKRFLNSEAIEARPPSLSYQLQKSFRKHRARYIAASTIMGLLFAGSAGIGIMGYRASSAEKLARQETSKANDALKKLSVALLDVKQERDRANSNQKLAEEKALEAEAEAAQKMLAAKRANDTAAAAKFQLANARWDAGQVGQARKILHSISETYRNNFEWHFCNRQFLGSDLTLYGHLREVCCVDYSPDGKRLVSGGRDGRIKIWDVVTGQEMATLYGHKVFVGAVSYSPDGKYIASGSADKMLKIWDADTHKELHVLRGHPDFVYTLCFSPDGKFIASASKDGTVHLWKVADGPPVKTLSLKVPKSIQHPGSYELSFSPDNRNLATAGPNGAIIIWDVETGIEKDRLQRRPISVPDEANPGWSNPGWLINYRTITSLRYNPNGKSLAAGYRDESIQFWDVATGKELPTLKGYEGGGSIRFSPDGLRLAAGDLISGKLKLWNVVTGREIATLRGHASLISGLSFSPDASRIASASGDGTVKVWDIANLANTVASRAHQGRVIGVAFDRDGRRLATGGMDDVIRVWDANSLEEIKSFPKKSISGSGVCFSPDWKLFATAGTSSEVTLWDFQSGDAVKTLEKQSSTQVRNICFSSDGEQVAAGCSDGSVAVWDTNRGTPRWHSIPHSKRVERVCFNKNGTRIASVDSQGEIKLSDARTGKEVMTLLHVGFTRDVGFSPDDKVLASAGREVRLWNVETGQVVCVLKGHRATVDRFSFNADGTRIVTGSQDGTVRLWNTKTGEEIKTLTNEPTWFHAVAFSLDGTRIATGSSDGAVRIWDASPTKEIRTLDGHVDTVTSVCFSPDGLLLASSGLDKTINLWNTKTREVVKSLAGHTEPVLHVSFSEDGKRLFSMATNERFAWDVATGEVLPNVEWKAVSGRTRHEKMRARFSGNLILLVDLDWKYTERENAYRRSKARPQEWWHREQLQLSINAEDWYAASFHAAWLLQQNPESQHAYSTFQLAFRQLDTSESRSLPKVIKDASALPSPVDMGSGVPADKN